MFITFPHSLPFFWLSPVSASPIFYPSLLISTSLLVFVYPPLSPPLWLCSSAALSIPYSLSFSPHPNHSVYHCLYHILSPHMLICCFVYPLFSIIFTSSLSSCLSLPRSVADVKSHKKEMNCWLESSLARVKIDRRLIDRGMTPALRSYLHD